MTSRDRCKNPVEEIKQTRRPLIASVDTSRQLKTKIAGRLPENRRDSFVDLQSQKDTKRNGPKIFTMLRC